MNFVKKVFVLLCSIFAWGTTQANISPLAFNGIFKHFKPGYELYAPNIGCAALKNGTIDAIRFYNVIPGPKDTQGRRLYIHDKAPKNDPFAELAILLFPSPAGHLTAMTNHSQSIGAQLTVTDIAMLLNFCARVRNLEKSIINKTWIPSPVAKLNPAIKYYQKHGAKALQAIQNYFFNKKYQELNLLKQFSGDPFFDKIEQWAKGCPKKLNILKLILICIKQEELYAQDASRRTSSFYSRYTPEMLINAFFCLKFGADDIPTLLQNLDDQIVDHKVKFDAGLIDKNSLQEAAKKEENDLSLDDVWIIQNRDLIDAIIPYARKCTPVNNGLAFGYDRQLDQMLVHSDHQYADCVETTIRHLCNLVLYSTQTKSWNLEHVKQIRDERTLENLLNFYALQTPERANSGEEAVRNAWSKIVSNLSGNTRYNKKFLKHTTSNDNEVDSGLVNIMRVLNTVFELECAQEPAFESDEQYQKAVQLWVKDGLKTLFQKLSPEKQAVGIEVTNVVVWNAADNSKDCSGIIKAQIPQLFEFTIKVSSSHAKFNAITIFAPEIVKAIPDISKRYATAFAQSAGEQIFMLNAATKNNASAPIHNLFSENIIDSATIIKLLEQLFEVTQKKAFSSVRAARILQNALQRFLWQDEEMSKLIQPVLTNFLSLKKNEIDLVLQQEVKALHLKTLSRFKTIEEVLSFFRNIERFEVGDEVGIKSLSISSKNFPNLKSLHLAATMSLETLNLSGTFNQLKTIELRDSGIKGLSISSENCPKLKALDVRFTKNLETLNFLGSFDQIDKLDLYASGVKSLSISGENFPNLKSLLLSDTNNLETLNLSGAFNQLEEINLFGSGIKDLAILSENCPNLMSLHIHHTKRLETLKLSGTFNRLKTIDLSQSEIKILTVVGESFSNLKTFRLGFTKNLETLNLSGTFNKLKKLDISYSGIKDLSISGENYPNLKTFTLRNTKNLETLNLSGTFNQLEEIDTFFSKIKSIELERKDFPKLNANSTEIKWIAQKGA